MRIRIRVSAPDGTPAFHVPWDYHLSMQSWVSQAISAYDEDLGEQIHQQETAPPFSYSRIVPTKSGRIDVSESHGLKIEDGFWFLSSDHQGVIQAVTEAAHEEALKLGHTVVPVESVDIEKVTAYSGPTEYVALSPVAISKYREEYKKYLPHDDPMWGHQVARAVRRQQEQWYPDGVAEEYEFDIRAVENANVTTRMGPGGHRKIDGTIAKLRIAADEQTSYHIQLQGLGVRTGQGFGSVIPVDDLPDEAAPEAL